MGDEYFLYSHKDLVSLIFHKLMIKINLLNNFLNRIDKTIVFHALSKEDIYRIIDVQIDELTSRLQKQKLGLTIDKKVKDWLLGKGYDVKNGVRPLRRLIQDEIEDLIAEGILEGLIPKGSILNLSIAKNKITYKVVS